MTDRERFEKVNPVPDGVVWNDNAKEYKTDRVFDGYYDADVYQAKFDGWKSRKSDPWDFAGSGEPGDKAELSVNEDGIWELILYSFSGLRFGLSSGCIGVDISRNGETRTWNEKKGEWE